MTQPRYQYAPAVWHLPLGIIALLILFTMFIASITLWANVAGLVVDRPICYVEQQPCEGVHLP